MILTAEELMVYADFEHDGWQSTYTHKIVKKLMIEFAKLHVKEALKEASKEAIIGNWADDYEIDKNSILNAYSLDLIK
jgi:hypothetical protein